jgi:antitoxin ParD1/3/4
VSDYFQSVSREPEQIEEDARLEALLMEGLAGGDDIPLTREFWTELETEAPQIAAKHKQRRG